MLIVHCYKTVSWQVRFESKAERLSVPLQFSLVNKVIGEHRPPGASEVVVGVQHIRRGVESVERWNLEIRNK